MIVLNFTVLPEEDGNQVKQILRARGVSVRITNQLKRVEGGMRLNNGAVARTIDPVRAGDVLTLRLPDDTEILEPMLFELEILYEDEHLLVVNKPPTMAMHPTRNLQGNSLANAVSGYMQGQGRPVVFRPVGRLDKGTSGVVVCALHAFAASKLNGKVQKTYVALVHGRYEGVGTFTNAIYRPKANCTLRACREEHAPLLPGDEMAVTHWEATSHNKEATSHNNSISCLKIWLETGRTHQIRAHFAHHGTPLLGDDYYGAPAREEPGHFLHCGQARLVHPVTNELLCVEAEMPAHMTSMVQTMNIN